MSANTLATFTANHTAATTASTPLVAAAASTRVRHWLRTQNTVNSANAMAPKVYTSSETRAATSCLQTTYFVHEGAGLSGGRRDSPDERLAERPERRGDLVADFDSQFRLSPRVRGVLSGRGRRGAVALALALGVLAAGGARIEARQGGSVDVPLSVILDWYLQGKVSVGTTIDIAHPGGIVGALERGGERWIAAGDPGQRSRRRLAAATFALEIGHGLPDNDRVTLARRLVLWGANLFRSTPETDPGERLWAVASIGLLEGVEDWTFLNGPRKPKPPSATGRADVWAVLDRGYVSQVRARFPDDPRLALAAVVAGENISWMVGAFGRNVKAADGFIAGELTPEYLAALDRGDLVLPDGSKWTGGEAQRAGRMHLARVEELRALVRQLEALTGKDEVAAEARLRLGLLQMRFVDRDRALAELALVQKSTTDRTLTYLSKFFTALVLERQGRDAAAADAYRDALALVPGAQSATARLSRLLFKLGRHDEAAAAAEQFFKAPAGALDPCLTYRTGDARVLTADLERLRETWR